MVIETKGAFYWENYVIRHRAIIVLPNCAGDLIYDYERWRERLQTQRFYFCFTEGSKTYMGLSLRSRCTQKCMHDLQELCM